MKIIKLEAENFKRLRAVTIRPGDGVTQITGANGHGKSSVLDAIFAAFGGQRAVPGEPIRHGSPSARIRVDTGEIIITRTFNREDETTSVTVTSPEGGVYKRPQELLDKLFRKIALDPQAFLVMTDRQRVEALRAVAPVDIDLIELDRLNLRDRELRKGMNARLAGAKEHIATIVAQADETVDAEEIDTAPMLARMVEASSVNAQIEAERAERRREATAIRDTRTAAASERATLLARLAQLDELEARLLIREAALQEREAVPLEAPVDVSGVKAAIEEAQARNRFTARERDRRTMLWHLRGQYADLEDQAKALTTAIEGREQEKRDAIARATMPVPGLSYDDNTIFFKGVPFEQASSAEKIRIAMGIAMATQPELRLVLIRDGSLLDEASLAIVAEMATERDFQVFVEVVGRDHGGILIEDGEIVAVNGKPTAREAA